MGIGFIIIEVIRGGKKRIWSNLEIIVGSCYNFKGWRNLGEDVDLSKFRGLEEEFRSIGVRFFEEEEVLRL